MNGALKVKSRSKEPDSKSPIQKALSCVCGSIEITSELMKFGDLLKKYAVNESWRHDVIVSRGSFRIPELLSSTLYNADS